MKRIILILNILIISIFFSSKVLPTNILLAPPWQLKTQSGETISLNDYEGVPIILHFWATWCPYCKKIQPKLVELEQKYRDSGIKIIAISFNEDEGVKPQYEINERGYHFITAINGESAVKTYGVKGTPTTFFINRQKQVVYKTTSSDVNNPNLELAVKQIIKPKN